MATDKHDSADQASLESALIEQARGLRSILLKNAAEAERRRRLPDENIRAIEESGLFRLMTPRRWGGHCASFRTLVMTAAELARACPSSGWIQSIANNATWTATLLPDRGQEEVFANDPEARACSVYAPVPKVRAVDGGFVVSGRWDYASGCWHASWAVLGFLIQGADGKVADHGVAVIPIRELAIEDTWFAAGMKGTGSATIIANEVFVPHHRVLSFPRLLAGERPAQRHNGEFTDHLSMMPILAVNLVAPPLGMAQAVLELVAEGTHRRGVTYTIYGRQSDSAVVHHQIGEAALKLDSAWFHTLRAADEIDAGARAGLHLDYLTRARIRGDAGYAARLVREVIDQLISIGSSAAFAEANPLQRYWRDANLATRHAALTIGPCLEIYGRAFLGISPNITEMI
jgi:3-hydroxy-9,10-secoandrosta-1,3,5(10)-triene-9,17-dione monooxygenase